MTQTNEYAKAWDRAEAKLWFYSHAGIYVAVMVFLVAINLLVTPQITWVVWPAIGWGFAVALHAVRVFLLSDRSSIVDALTEHELQQSRPRKTNR